MATGKTASGGMATGKTASGGKTIEVRDESGAVLAEIGTERPEWSFEQWCRNRPATVLSWRFRAG